MISEEMLKVLACPLDKAELKLEQNVLVCTKCGAKYPIKDGIPVLLPPEEVAKVVPKKELEKKEEI